MRIVKIKGVFENLKIPTYVDFFYLRKEEEQCYLLSPAGKMNVFSLRLYRCAMDVYFMFTYPTVTPLGNRPTVKVASIYFESGSLR